MNFDELVGKEFDFYGVDNNCFKLGDTIFEAVEDEDDGYRSCMKEVLIRTDTEHGLIFFQRPVAEVRVAPATEHDFDGYMLIDTNDGHKWFKFGTADSSDYYPCFRVEYNPKPPKEPAMTVKRAQEIVRSKHPQAITGIVRGTAWLAVKNTPHGTVISGYHDTKGLAWKDAAQRILQKRTN